MSVERARITIVAATLSFATIFAASNSPTPMFEFYRQTEGMTKVDLSIATVSYLVAAVTALVVCGRLADRVGRRPVALAALAVTACGCAILAFGHGPTALAAGRAFQGLGSGLAFGGLAAYVVDSLGPSRTGLGAVLASGGPLLGGTIGLLGSGALLEYGPMPRQLPYLIGIGLSLLCIVLVLLSAETVERRPGAWRSLWPRLSVPRTALPLLPAASCIFAATWALGGFYGTFGPTLAADEFGTSNALIGAILLATQTAPMGIASPLSVRLPAATAQVVGAIAFLVSVVGLVVALADGALILFLAFTAMAGAASGVAFAGSTRLLLPKAAPTERAALLSVIYVISYSGAALSSLVAGQASKALTMPQIGLGYAAVAAVACLVTLLGVSAARRA